MLFIDHDLHIKWIKYIFVDLSMTLPMISRDICQNTEDNEIKIPSWKVSENSCKISQKEHKSEEFDDDDVDEKKQQINSFGDFNINEESLNPDIVVNDLGKVVQEYSNNDDTGFKKEYEVF